MAVSGYVIWFSSLKCLDLRVMDTQFGDKFGKSERSYIFAAYGFGLISLFNGISTFLGYLMPKSPL